MAALRIVEDGGLLAGDIKLLVEKGDNDVREEVRDMVEEQGKQIADINTRLTRHLGGPVPEGHPPDLGEFGRFAVESQKRDDEQTILLKSLLEVQQATRGAVEGVRRDVDLLKAGQKGMFQRVTELCKRAEPVADFMTSKWGKIMWAAISSSVFLLYAKNIFISGWLAAIRLFHTIHI